MKNMNNKQTSSSKKIVSSKKIKVNQKIENASISIEEIDKFENQNLKIDLKVLKKLDYDDIQEIYQIFNDIDDEDSKAIVRKAMETIKPPDIEIAKISHRIWTYFYEKLILRIAFFIWFLQLNFLKNIFSFEISFSPNFDTSNIPSIFKKVLFSNSGSHLILGGIIFLLGFICLWVIWKIWLAYLESRYNKNHSGSTFLRRKVGLIVVDKKGETIGWLRVFLRGLFRIPIVSMIMIISMELSDKQRGLHDKVFGTYVLRLHKDLTSQEIAFFITQNY